MKDQLAVLIAQMNESGILYSEAVREFKKVYLTHVLRECKGNQCMAARRLGMHRNTLGRTLAELELDPRSLRKSKLQATDTKEMRRPPRSVTAVPAEKRAAK